MCTHELSHLFEESSYTLPCRLCHIVHLLSRCYDDMRRCTQNRKLFPPRRRVSSMQDLFRHHSPVEGSWSVHVTVPSRHSPTWRPERRRTEGVVLTSIQLTSLSVFFWDFLSLSKLLEQRFECIAYLSNR